ncbi:unnamed protein product [Lactuca virosa]|uniref:Uncharacterized protein n=1 Tax=Lactuca virosa TaxID=75947 RepID=A0AAU9M264_9ASTR|nr:unnamed protein product [Lactuca virosa]
MDTPIRTHASNLDHSLMGSRKPSSFPTNLAQSGCFGSFPSKVITSPLTEQAIENQVNGMGRSGKKRRSLSRSSTNELSKFPVHNLFGVGDGHSSEVGSPRLNSSSPKLTEANKVPRISEIEVTVEVGAMIGFEIDASNKLLVEILGVNGE